MAINRQICSVLIALACLIVAGGIAWSFKSKPQIPVDGEEMTASLGPKSVGPSGFPIPRFVSLKTDKVNVRRGPSSDHAVAWVFQRKGMPVEIVAESDNWRRIRDSDGEQGWILQNMLSGKRTAAAAPWRRGETLPLHSSPEQSSGLVAQLSAGVVGDVSSCTGEWCEFSAGGYEGWIEQTMLWGVYPGEVVE